MRVEQRRHDPRLSQYSSGTAGSTKDDRMLEAPAKTDDEPRFLVIGKIGENHWAAVCAHRGDNVRIISMRRARKQEIDHYESN